MNSSSGPNNLEGRNNFEGGKIFQSALWVWNIKIICSLMVDLYQALCLSGVSLYMVIYRLSTTLLLHILSSVVKYSPLTKIERF